ncbi:MAG TPA: right-handed parallel beta-helix repeat-containing protein [Tepidisphaeraceae bacterium]|nr:right-handed parallel beta-helix repeat-containing protein [Tepidisphaeraceae bacterium]
MVARFLSVFTLVVSPTAFAADVFVAPDGDDANAGTREKPLATVQKAQDKVGPGDTVIVRGGTYAVREEQIARKRRGWAYVTFLDKSGEKGLPITYRAADGERPVFDFSAVKPDARVHAFQVSGSWLHIKGIEVIGVQVTKGGHTQSVCFASDGSHNVLENLSMHDGQAIGIYHIRGSDNLFLNCDAYRNHDHTSEDGKGGNTDGFGGHPSKGSTGNVFRGCRAWFNADDGFDLINAHEAVTIENCWAMYNGFGPKFERLADGNGFKAGGYGSTPAGELPRTIPRHIVRNCVAVANKNSGFYANHHPGGIDWIHNSAYRNGANFNMLNRLADNVTDVDGYGHKLINNLAYKGRDLARIDAAKCELAGNSFTLGLKPAAADFEALDEEELVGPRRADGGLPAVKFMRPAAGSVVVDRGVETGGAFRGQGPDVGAFER